MGRVHKSLVLVLEMFIAYAIVHVLQITKGNKDLQFKTNNEDSSGHNRGENLQDRQKN